MKTLLENIREMLNDAIAGKLDGITNVSNNLSVSLDFKAAKPKVLLTEDAGVCDGRYSMLKHMEFSWRWKMSECRSDLINYINIVDVCNSSDV